MQKSVHVPVLKQNSKYLTILAIKEIPAKEPIQNICRENYIGTQEHPPDKLVLCLYCVLSVTTKLLDVKEEKYSLIEYQLTACIDQCDKLYIGTGCLKYLGIN